MDINAWGEAIQNFGLPIVIIGVLMFFVYKLWQQSKDREEKLYTELSECRKVNSEAIKTLGVYAERLGVIENDVSEIKTDVNSLMSKL